MNIKRILIQKSGELVVAFATKIATIEANASCPYISYQPKKPDSVKKLRKF